MTNMIVCSTFALIFALSSLQSAPNKPQSRLESLAANGQIQNDAPVKANSEITVHAVPDKVWAVLTNINDWPKWQSTVTAAHLEGTLGPGVSFNWTNGGTKIKGRLALVETNRRIAWTGTASGTHAIHVWNLEPLSNDSTLVKTAESMEGFLLTIFYSSKELAESHRVWLDALKHKLEP